MSTIEIGRRLVNAVPDNHKTITSIVTEKMKAAGCYDRRPTNLDTIINDNKMILLNHDEDKVESFVLSLPEGMQRKFRKASDKFKGVFGFRDRTIYIPKQDKPIYEFFPKAHEITHGILPWHDTSFMDDSMTLRPEFRAQREREANFGASEIIFHGDMFVDYVTSKHESLNWALAIASDHGATAASTFWRYVQIHDRSVALLVYNAITGNLQRAVASSSFQKKWLSISIPTRLKSDHEWSEDSLSIDNINKGECHLSCENGKCKLEWQSWKNRYSTSVLLVAPSRLHTVGSLLRDFRSLVGKS